MKLYKRDPRIIILNSITRDLFIIRHNLESQLNQFSEDDINYEVIKIQLDSTVKTYNEYKEKYSQIRKEYGWDGKYSLADFRKEQSHHFKGAIGSMVVSKLSERACRAVEQIEKGKAEKVNFVRNDDDFSIDGATNNDGIYIRNGILHFNRHSSVAIKPARKNDDKYYTEALQNRIKYCRLLSRTIRGKKRYYVHVLLEGTPPNYRVYGDGKIELLDVKISHLEMQIDGKREVIELAPGCKNQEARIAEIERKMDASRRISNPGNYNEDKTIKKGSKQWTYGL